MFIAGIIAHCYVQSPSSSKYIHAFSLPLTRRVHFKLTRLARNLIDCGVTRIQSMYIVNLLCNGFCKSAKACLNIEIYEWKLQRHTGIMSLHISTYMDTVDIYTYPVTTTTKSRTFHPFRRYESVCNTKPRAIIFNAASRQNIANKYISASS